MRQRVDRPRNRALFTGLALFVLGVWGAIVPFIGPWFHYSYMNHTAWSWPTYGRLWLEILPGALAALAGLSLIGSWTRVGRTWWGMVAVAAGTWFVCGQAVSGLWNHGVSQAGRPLGGTFMRVIEQLGYFYLLGGAIIFFGTVAMAYMAGRTATPDVMAYDTRGRMGRGVAPAGAGTAAPVTGVPAQPAAAPVEDPAVAEPTRTRTVR